jgi:peroxiredoxin
MTQATKLQAGSDFPALSVPKVGGGDLKLGAGDGWRAVVVYRGKHCPLCRRYLKTLDGMLDDFTNADIGVTVVSADPKEKAESMAAEEGWRFPVGYGLSTDQMRTLGLYISDPRSPQETDRPFAEPGVFVVNAQGKVQVIDISNAPYARPDLASLLNGIKATREKNNPIRGMKA